MKDGKLSLLGGGVNCPIVKVNGREYPGVILQGDTLFSLYRAAERVISSSKAGAAVFDYDSAEFLRDSLKEYLSVYEDVLLKNGIELPYVKKVP